MPLARTTSVATLLILVLAGWGCGGTDKSTGGRSAHDSFRPLTRSTIEQIGRAASRVRGADPSGVDGPSAVRTVLNFWQDAQFQNYARMYQALTPSFRTAVPYRKFAATLEKGRGLFLTRPRVIDIRRTGPTASVYIGVSTGAVVRDSDPLVTINLELVDRRWRIAPDPMNLFRSSAG